MKIKIKKWKKIHMAFGFNFESLAGYECYHEKSEK